MKKKHLYGILIVFLVVTILPNFSPVLASVGCVDNQAPVPIIDTISHSLVVLGETVEFSGEDSFDPDSDVLTYLWAVNQLGIKEYDESFNFIPPTVGEYVVTLVAGDRCGAWNVTWTIIHVVESTHCAFSQKPTSVIEPQFTTIIQGDTINFDSSQSSDPDGDMTSYLWAVNQLGVKETQPNFNFTPPEPGQYVVTLVVGDECGNWEVTSTVINVEPDFTKKADFNMEPLEYVIFNEGNEGEPQVPAIYVMPCNLTDVDITEPTEVLLTIGDNNARIIPVPFLNAGDCLPVPTFLHELEPLLPGPGDYLVTAEVDFDNRINESDETNNIVSEVIYFDLVNIVN